MKEGENHYEDNCRNLGGDLYYSYISCLFSGKSLLFIKKSAYQINSRKVYPFPTIGGRIHYAYDKSNRNYFIYYNHIINRIQ